VGADRVVVMHEGIELALQLGERLRARLSAR
jgi:hypothetical protein